MNRLARLKGTFPWKDWGKVTHAGAAVLHAEYLDVIWHNSDEDHREIETREEGGDTIYEHNVKKEVKYNVTSNRGDEETMASNQDPVSIRESYPSQVREGPIYMVVPEIPKGCWSGPYYLARAQEEVRADGETDGPRLQET